MTKQSFEVGHWVEMFREIGLDEAAMHRWHAVFERRHPAAHQRFLEWLGMPERDIERVRTASRGEWAGA